MAVVDGAGADRALRLVAAGGLGLRHLHEGGADRLSRHPLRLALLDLRRLRGGGARALRSGSSGRSLRGVDPEPEPWTRRGRAVSLADPVHPVDPRHRRAGRARPADRPRDDRGLDPLSASRRARHGHRRRAAAERPVHQLHPARRAAVHPRRRADELGQHDRRACCASATRWSAASAAGWRYVNVVQSIIFAGMSGSAIADAAGTGKMMQKMMTEGRQVPAGLRRRADRVLGGDRADHPAVDPDGDLRARLGRLDRLPVPGGRGARACSWGSPRWADRRHGPAPELSGRGAGAAARAARHHRRGPSRR